MIAAPAVGVVHDHLVRDLAEHRIVRATRPLGVTDDHVGADVEIAAIVVVLVGDEQLVHRRLAGRRVDELCQLRPQLVHQRRLLRRRHDAVLLPAGQIHVQAVEAHSVGACARPVDVGEQAGVAALPVVLQHQVALVLEPGVQVERAPPGGEAVVRHDDQDVVGLQRGHGLADDAVDLLVEIRDHVGVLRVDGRIVGRMPRIHRPPDDVRDLVRVPEVVEEEAALGLGEDVVVLPGDLLLSERGLSQKLVQLEDAVRHRLGVLRHPLRSRHRPTMRPVCSASSAA